MRDDRQEIAVAAPRPETICALFVTYHPDAGFPDRVAAIRGQVGACLIVDNGADPDERKMLADLSRRQDVRLLLNDENVGLAAALNRGFAWARGNGFHWVIYLDQDSRPAGSLVETLVTAFEEYPRKERIAVIGSYYWLAKRKHALRTDRSWFEEKTVITSGSMFSLPIHDRLGPFREDFFVDYVDNEYCLRARKNGCSVLAAKEISIRHAIGSPTLHTLFGRPYRVSNHPPWRRYHQARNLVLVARKYFPSDPVWVINELWFFVVLTGLMLLFESGRREKFGSILLGFLHGLLGKTGRMHAA